MSEMKFNQVKALLFTLSMVTSATLTGCSMEFKPPVGSTIESTIEKTKDVIDSAENTVKKAGVVIDKTKSAIDYVKNDEGVQELLDEFGKKLDDTDFKDEESIADTVETVREEGNKIAEVNGIQFQEATLVRVVDGDTIVVNIDNEDYKVRMIGINTPESVASKEYLEKKGTTNSEEGFKASDVTKALLEGVDTVYLQKDTSNTDKWGRLLRYVWLEVPEEINTDTIANEMVNGILLTAAAEKVAEPASYSPDTEYEDEFEDIYENY
jgi:endonuclease YncB( thermonuclease family)